MFYNKRDESEIVNMQKKIGMVIINYNDFELTSRLLKNIKNYKCLEKIVVVDNNSSDNSFEKLKEFESNRITIIKNSSRHFSSGLNVGAKCLIKKGVHVENAVIDKYSTIENDVIGTKDKPVYISQGKKVR